MSTRSMLRRGRLATAALLAIASCHTNLDHDEQPQLLVKVAPAALSSTGAWSLFDRSTGSSFIPGPEPIRVTLDHVEEISAIKVFGGSQYRLRVSGLDGSAIGFPTIDLSQQSAGWHVFQSSALVSTNVIELRFEPIGNGGKVPEVELWAVGDEAPTNGRVDLTSSDLPNRFVTVLPGSRSAELPPSECATFEFNLLRSPAELSRLYLAYSGEGLLRSFSLRRTVNGVAELGGAWLAGDASSRNVVDELDPSTLHLGKNEVGLCVPGDATRGVALSNVHLVGEMDDGAHVVDAISIGEQARDGSSLFDQQQATTMEVAKGERVLVGFGRLIAPDVLVLNGASVVPSDVESVECLDRAGGSQPFANKPQPGTSGLVVTLDGGNRACAAIAVTLTATRTLSELDVVGSGAAEAIDWPRLVITSAPEHFGTSAWVSGFVARPPAMTGAIRMSVNGQPADSMTGEFGQQLHRGSEAIVPWPVSVTATLPDGTTQTKQIVLERDMRAQLVHTASDDRPAQSTSSDAFGAAGDAVVVRANKLEPAKVRLGTHVGVDVPAGAVRQATDIRVKHLRDEDLPPLDPGMVNVTAPNGSRGYEFLPHGQRFAKAVDVVLPYDATLIPEGMTPDDVHAYFYDPKEEHWKRLDRTAIDVGERVTHSSSLHFTVMINAVLTVPKNAGPLSFDPTALSSIAAASPSAGIDLIEPPVPNSMGDARVSLPIQAPAGRGSYSPTPAISYDSAGGNSWLGLHWDLAISRIEIDTRWGVPRYDGSERYVLNGAELVPTTETEGPACPNGSPGLRFHTRVEGGFAHILRCQYASPDGPKYYFEVRDRDGTLFVYGDRPADAATASFANLADPGAPTHVARWQLARVIDRHGNITRYHYVVDEIAGAEPGRQIYPDQITYTESATLAPVYRITFELDDARRADQMSSGRTGFLVITRHLLRAVHVQFRNQDVRTYVLTYGPGTFAKSLLAGIRVYGVGGCSAGSNAFQQPGCVNASFLDEHSFDYYREEEGFAAPVQVAVDGPSVTEPVALDMGATSSTTGGLFAGAEFGGVKATLGGTIETGSRDQIVTTQDVNGDGLPDELVQDASGAIHVLYNMQLSDTLFPSKYAVDPHYAVVGLGRLGHEGHGSWGIQFGAEAGISVSGSYSDSASYGKARLTDIDGDGYADLLQGRPTFGRPCTDGMCFVDGAFAATSSIDPHLDPVLGEIAGDLAQRLILADPVVQWQAPRPGRATVTATARRLGFGTGALVTVQVYRSDPVQGDRLIAERQLSWMETEEVTLNVGALDLSESDTFYVRVDSGGAIATGGVVEPLVDANLHVAYQSDCSGALGCQPIGLPAPHEPTGAALYSFDARDDFRVAGQPTFVVAPVTGKLLLAGTLRKDVTVADIRACVQVLPGISSDGAAPSFIEPCEGSSSDVRNVSGTFRLGAREAPDETILLDIDVTAGQLVMLRVESDFSFDPSAIHLLPPSDGKFVRYEQVCLPADGQEQCTTDPGAVASVALPGRSTTDFGPYIALASYTATPLVAVEEGSVTVEPLSIDDPGAVFAIRSDQQGIIQQFDCSRVDCSDISPPSFHVTAGESVSFEIAGSAAVFSLPSSVRGTISGADYEVAIGKALRRNGLSNRGPFVGGYHGWRAGLWNEAEAFAPTQLLEDYEQAQGLSAERRLQILRSALAPLPAFGHDPVLGTTLGWRGADSTAYISANALNAGLVGLVPDGASGEDGGGLFARGYMRISGTISKAIGIAVHIVNVADLFGVNFDMNAGSSNTVTTTDELDLNGDGILDVLTGRDLFLGDLTSDPMGRGQLPGFFAGGGFRKRHSIDYGVGMGIAVPCTTSSGRTTMMCKKEDDPRLGVSRTTGLAVQRNATTDDIVDVNSDGLPDAVRRAGTSILVRYNLGNRLTEWQTFGNVDPELAVAIDGFESVERSTDWIPLVGEIVETGSRALQHDTTLTQHTTDSVDLLFYSHSTTTSTSASRTTRMFADLNGDGLPDLLVKKADEPFIRVQYNLGSTFAAPTHWAVPAWPSGTELSPVFDSKFGSLLLTGPDVLAGTGSQVAKSTSSTVSIPIPGTPVIVGGSYATAEAIDTYELALMDIDGDASADHVLKRASGNGVTFWVKRNRASGKGNLLQTVHGPLGGSFTLDYQRTPNTVDIPHSRYVLRKVEVDDGVDLGARFASPNLVTTIQYEHGIYQRHEKEFYGFEKVTSTRLDGTSTEQIYFNDPTQYALRGRLRAEIHRDPKQALLSRHDLGYAVLDVVDTSGQRVTPDASCTEHLHPLLAREAGACQPSFAVVVQDSETHYEHGAESKTRTQRTLASDFDRFGNELASTDEADDAIGSDDAYASATYRNDTTNWILGQPTSLEARAGGPGGQLLRARRGDYNALGDLIAVHVDTGTQTATTRLAYDAFGNLNHLETPPNHRGQPQTLDIVYDPEAATYPVSTTNGFGETSTAVYDLRFGVATRQTDVNGQSVTRTLDEHGRLIAVRSPYDTQGPGLEMSYVLDEPHKRAVTITHPAAPPGVAATLASLTAVTVVDGFGRTIEQRKTAVVDGVLGMTTSGVVQRDRVDRVIRTYQPFFTPGSGDSFEPPQETLSTATVYDEHDRLSIVTYPDDAREVTEYAIEAAPVPGTPLLLATKTTAPNGNKRESYADLLGRVRAFVEHPTATQSPVTAYDYLATGELARIVDAENNASTLAYDLRGLRTALANPDTGLIEDRYDLMGNRITLTEPNHRALGVQVNFRYDRDRLTRIDYPSKPAVRYEYGGPGASDGRVGRLFRVTDESGTQEHSYGALGELRRTVRTVVPDQQGSQPIVFDTSFASDSLGRMLRIVYPDRVEVTNTYDAAGKLAAVSGAGNSWGRTYASDIQYDVFGNRTQLRYGNGVVTTWHYDPARIRLDSLTTTLPGTSATTIQDLHYGYDAASNPLSIENRLQDLSGGSGNRPGHSTLSLTYDGVDRVRTALGDAQLSAQKTTHYDEQFEYTPSHNILHKQRAHFITQPGTPDTAPNATNFASDYLYQGGRPHLPSQIGDLLVTYDASGNATQRKSATSSRTESLVWDDDNRLVDFTSGGVHQHNTYDASGNRVRRKSTQSETLFASHYFDLENGTQGVRHVFAGGTRVASELGKFSSGATTAPTKPGTVYFFHADRLGSTSVLTAVDASVYESLEYFVDGEMWIDRAPQKPVNRYLFSGKPFDPDTGFYDFGQRFYDPRTSLWLGVDSAFKESPSGSIQRPFSLSLLSFSAHNPLRFSDPDGREVTIEEQANGVCYADASCSGGAVEWKPNRAGELEEHLSSENAWQSPEEQIVASHAVASFRLAAQGRSTTAHYDDEHAWAVEAVTNPSWQKVGKVLLVAGALALPLFGRQAQLEGVGAAVDAAAVGEEASAGSLILTGGRQLTANEITTGQRLARQLGRDLMPSVHEGAEYVDALGTTYDAMGELRASQYWNENAFLRSIDRHLLKSNDFTVIDLTGFTDAQKATVRSYVGNLPAESQAKIITIE